MIQRQLEQLDEERQFSKKWEQEAYDSRRQVSADKDSMKREWAKIERRQRLLDEAEKQLE